MKRITWAVVGFGLVLCGWGIGHTEMQTAGRHLAASPTTGSSKADAYCRSHPVGPSLEMLMMSGSIGQGFVIGEIEAVDGRKLTVRLLKGDRLQSVELDRRAIICFEEKKSDPRSIAPGDLKVGEHVVAGGELVGGVFMVRKVFYALILADDEDGSE